MDDERANAGGASGSRSKRRSEWLERTRELPEDAGVYLMKDASGEVVYVGKAKNLRARVGSYFQRGTSDYRAFVGILAGTLADIETIRTRSEKEALLLEREMIRRHRPRFNVIWRDDKQYLCLRVDPAHEYPWVEVVRRTGGDGARYFGPFHSASAARKTLRVVNRHFQLRTCRDSVLYSRTRPCLEYQIGRCPGPCVYEIDREKYREGVDHVLMFLEGKAQDLVERLEARMWAAAERTDYELAAHYRDQMRAVEKTLERQEVAFPSLVDRDVFGTYCEGRQIAIATVEVRGGRVENVSTQVFESAEFDAAELLESFVLQRYADAGVPDEILLPEAVASRAALEEIVSERSGHKVRVRAPKRGHRRALLDLAARNAEHGFHEHRSRSGAVEEVLEALKKSLRLRRLPKTIECYDISNLGSSEIVGSRVVFELAQPNKGRYRRYRVKLQSDADDFRAMYEVLSRRLTRGLREGDLPDLMLIDGGKGQLNVARAALRDHGVTEVEVASLAKSRVTGKDRDDAAVRSPERVFLPEAKDPLVLPASAPELLLLARIRDEAHRFAVTFHQMRRQKARMRSPLDSLPGVGPIRRRALLRHFGSLDEVRRASLDAFMSVPGLGPLRARRIWAVLHPEAASARAIEPDPREKKTTAPAEDGGAREKIREEFGRGS